MFLQSPLIKPPPFVSHTLTHTCTCWVVLLLKAIQIFKWHFLCPWFNFSFSLMASASAQLAAVWVINEVHLILSCLGADTHTHTLSEKRWKPAKRWHGLQLVRINLKKIQSEDWHTQTHLTGFQVYTWQLLANECANKKLSAANEKLLSTFTAVLFWLQVPLKFHCTLAN